MTPDLEHALRLADAADAITKRYYLTTNLQVQEKPDKTPVTEADLAVEEALSTIVATEFGEQYVGEEGTREGASSRRWVVDPIDGTRNFMRNMPVWATLIALFDGDKPVVSVVSAPALGRRWWAAAGQGAFTQDVDGTVRQLHVSKVSKLEDAFVLHSTLFTWDEIPTGSAAMIDLLKSAWRHRGVGDFFNHMLVAEGAADACAEPNMKEWDIAGPALIILEAGGSVWSAATPNTAPSDPRPVVTSNGLLEAEVKKRLNLA